MFSSDTHINAIAHLLADFHRHLELRAECFKVDAVSKLSKLLTVLALSIILFMLGSLALWFISMMAATALGEWLNSPTAGYAIVVGFYLLLGCVIYARRKEWIETPVTDFLAKLFLGEPAPGDAAKPEPDKHEPL